VDDLAANDPGVLHPEHDGEGEDVQPLVRLFEEQRLISCFSGYTSETWVESAGPSPSQRGISDCT
jgi:hypothetical protein